MARFSGQSMEHAVTLQRPDSGAATVRRPSYLPPDLLEQVRGRLRLLAILSIIGFALGPAIMLLILVANVVLDGELPPDFHEGIQFVWFHLAAIALSAALWWRARNPGVPAASLLTLGQVYEVTLCLILGVVTYWSEWQENQELPRLTWIPAIVILFPLLTPGPPRRLLWSSLLAGAMAPLTLAGLQAAGAIEVNAHIYISSILNSGCAVLFAQMGARTVYGLGKQVVEARELGSYQLERVLGQGGMGEVWLARHRLLARPAAIKVIRPEVLESADADPAVVLQRFEREAQATAALRSPHTIGLYDYGAAADGTFYYVMELLDGLDAASLVERFGPLPPARAVFLLKQVCLSLSEAHAAGLIHRDIKPANLFVCRYGEEMDFVKVLDFGLVKGRGADRRSGSAPTETLDRGVGGTPAFMAPEQALGDPDLDGRVDIYALGCVAYWLLTGQPVFEGRTPVEVITHHVKDAPVPVSQVTELTVPPSLERVVMACLEKAREDRPASARELLEQLEACDTGAWTREQARRWWSRHLPG